MALKHYGLGFQKSNYFISSGDFDNEIRGWFWKTSAVSSALESWTLKDERNLKIIRANHPLKASTAHTTLSSVPDHLHISSSPLDGTKKPSCQNDLINRAKISLPIPPSHQFSFRFPGAKQNDICSIQCCTETKQTTRNHAHFTVVCQSWMFSLQMATRPSLRK